MEPMRAMKIIDYFNGDPWPEDEEFTWSETVDAARALHTFGLTTMLPGRYGRAIHEIYNKERGA